jgi:hypothetical protein
LISLRFDVFGFSHPIVAQPSRSFSCQFIFIQPHKPAASQPASQPTAVHKLFRLGTFHFSFLLRRQTWGSGQKEETTGRATIYHEQFYDTLRRRFEPVHRRLSLLSEN